MLEAAERLWGAPSTRDSCVLCRGLCGSHRDKLGTCLGQATFPAGLKPRPVGDTVCRGNRVCVCSGRLEPGMGQGPIVSPTILASPAPLAHPWCSTFIFLPCDPLALSAAPSLLSMHSYHLANTTQV